MGLKARIWILVGFVLLVTVVVAITPSVASAKYVGIQKSYYGSQCQHDMLSKKCRPTGKLQLVQTTKTKSGVRTVKCLVFTEAKEADAFRRELSKSKHEGRSWSLFLGSGWSSGTVATCGFRTLRAESGHGKPSHNLFQ